MKSFLALVLGLAVICSTALAADDNDSAKQKAATQAAQQWLKIVDDGKYADSWDEAATIFKEKVSNQQWQGMLEQTRTPLGKVHSRIVKGTTYATVLPNAPKGEYVIVQFETTLDGMSKAIETVTPFLDKDGKWRVAGYFIKPAIS